MSGEEAKQPLPGVGKRVVRDTFLQNRLRNYQILATVLLGLVVALVAAEIYFRTTTKVQLHVVEVDHLGNVRGSGAARSLDTADPRLIRAQLVDWVRLARTVTADARIQDLYVRSATARTRGVARAVLNEHLESSNPFRAALRTLIEVRDVTALPIEGTETWEIQWTERVRAAQSGRAQGIARWRAIASFRFEPPEAAEQETNPLGFVISHLSWTHLGDDEVQKGNAIP